MNEETNIETEDETVIAQPTHYTLKGHVAYLDDECDCFECKQGLECVIPF